MATTTSLKLTVQAKITEAVDSVGAGDRTSVHSHLAELIATYANGTGANQQDLVYSTTHLDGNTIAYNLDALVSEGTGATVALANVSGFMVINSSTQSAQTLTIGAGSNPWITWLNATGDAVVIGPGGVFLWTSPVDAAAITASTGDLLTITPSAAFSYTLIVWGQSA